MLAKLRPYERIKPRAKADPTAAEQRHMDRVAGLGCVVCGADASLHHIMHMLGKQRRRDHRFIVGLCWEHHQGKTGVHGLGGEEAFEQMHDINLPARAVREWENSCGAAEEF